ncbi:DNA polymerase III, subunit gamma/tau [secondary endosymbiont of Heteropsylla cubana]|uniref:DNA-directed DNA polymerase n=1 Tax=secondary endosymbiont of Heteropsylla cubana TaxID=134287 RepID=J3Z5U0_9ENTR|nr:DNA polymerase III subunit gamma/tau [secondary endosymbiont of Heteropsylla cubana]AFP85724.1 DNA polymerase III, subunit gamma/tau [secondary endosymbiont of Heteropsylla cubana]
MSYKVLARKWRPKIFADVVGQEHVMQVLANSLLLNRVHHAYLFSGTRGIGKTTIARLLAKSLNCVGGMNDIPCGHCDYCQEIEHSRFVDLIELDAASRTKVEDIRELLDNVQYAPTAGRFKVYLIDEVHMLSRHSFNALLKTLEEPPSHVKFILATTDPKKIPLTILSRCIQFHLKVLNVNEIRNHLFFCLKKENITSEPRALQLLACAANGSMRDAFSLTDQAIAMGGGSITVDSVSIMLGSLDTEKPLAIIEALVNADGVKMMRQVAKCAAHGVDWENLLIEMLALLHRLVFMQVMKDQVNPEEDLDGIIPRLNDLSRRVLPSDLQLYYQTLLVGRKELAFAPDPRMGVEMTLLRALAFHPADVQVVTRGDIIEKKTPKFFFKTSKKKIADTKVSTDCRLPLAISNLNSDTLIDKNIICSERNIATSKKNDPKLFSDADVLLVKQQDKVLKNKTTFNELSKQVVNSTFSSISNPISKKNICSGKGLSISSIVLTSQKISSLENDPKLINLRSTEINLKKPFVSSRKCDYRLNLNNQDKMNLNKEIEVEDFSLLPSKKKYKTLPKSVTTQILEARNALLTRKENRQKKNELPVIIKKQTAVSKTGKHKISDKKISRSSNTIIPIVEEEVRFFHERKRRERVLEQVKIPILSNTFSANKNNLDLVLYLSEELLIRDPWAAEINRLALPKFAQKLALNSWKEEDLDTGNICLHLRSARSDLNSFSAKHALCIALSIDQDKSIELIVKEDNDLKIKTPLELCQDIYKETVIQAKKNMVNDMHVKRLCCLFDAEIDEDSICIISSD